MLDGNVVERVEPTFLRSYFQSRTARAMLAPVLGRLVAPEDSKLVADLKIISDILVEPALDASEFTRDQLSNSDLLNHLFATEQKMSEHQFTIFDGLVQKYGHDYPTLKKLLNYTARIGQISKVGGAHAHDNVLEDARPLRDAAIDRIKQNGGDRSELAAIIPDSIEENILTLIEEGNITSWPEFFSALSKARLSAVSTSHPTRYLHAYFTKARLGAALAFRELTRRVAGGDVQAYHDYATGREVAGKPVSKAFRMAKKLFQAPLTYEDKNGDVTNMTPFDEIIAAMIDARDDFTRNISEIYRTFDDGLQRLSDAGLLPEGMVYDDEARKNLILPMEFLTWVMGDKDGNNNIRSEHLLLAPLVFRRDVAKQNAKILRSVDLPLLRQDGKPWEDYFTAKDKEMRAILAKLKQRTDAAGGIDLPLTRQEFLDAKQAIKDVYGDIDVVTKAYDADLVAYLATNPEPKLKKAALALLRICRTKGLHGLRFHLRETAEMYTPVVDTLLKGNTTLFDGKPKSYAEMDDELKLITLNQALQAGEKNPGLLKQLKANFFARLERDGKSTADMRGYKGKDGKVDADVITLHTLQRFEVGTLQNNLITDHILAECKGALQVMETLLLARVVGIDFTIAPLLEELKTLKLAAPIILDLFHQPAWRDYAWSRTKGDLTQIFAILKEQYAHSDNMRRSGFAATRVNVYHELHELPLTMEQNIGMILDKFIADNKITEEEKNRVLTVMGENPHLYDIQKFQGGARADLARSGVGAPLAFVNDANLHWFFQTTDQGGDNPEIRLLERMKRNFTTLISRNAIEIARQEKGEGIVWNRKRETALCDAISLSINPYHANHYGAYNQLGKVMAEAGLYHTRVMPGSRQARNDDGSATDIFPTIAEIKPQDIRTIGFTTTGVGMGVGFTVLPMRYMNDYINQVYATNLELRAELQQDAENGKNYNGGLVFDEATGKLTMLGLQTLYRVSPSYRAGVSDFPAFGVAISNLQRTVKLLKQRHARGAPEVTQGTLDYFEKSLPKDIVGAAVPFLLARGFEIPEKFISHNELANPNPETCAKLSFLIRHVAMPQTNEQLTMTSRFMDLGCIVREHVFTQAIQHPDKPYSKLAMGLFRMADILGNMFGYQIFDGTADTRLARMRVANRPKHEPKQQPSAYVPMPAAA